MLAATRDDVTDLNQHARAALQTEGVVGPDQLTVDTPEMWAACCLILSVVLAPLNLTGRTR